MDAHEASNRVPAAHVAVGRFRPGSIATSLMVLVGVLLAVGACGSEPTIESVAPTTTVTLGRTQPVPGGVVSLAVRFDQPLRSGTKPVWFLTVSNNGESANLTFSSGQRGDVVLLAADGAEVYRWSKERSFIQVVTTEALLTGDSLVYELRDSELTVPPGDYDLVASIVATPEVPPVRLKVTVEAA